MKRNVDGIDIEMTAKEEATHIAEGNAWREGRKATVYQQERRYLYPEIGDQLDALYHAGGFPTEMAAKIKEVKDAWPKGATEIVPKGE